MTPEIKQAIQRGKTCAPVGCDSERTCFLLAMECERLHEQLDVARTNYLQLESISTLSTHRSQPAKTLNLCLLGGRTNAAGFVV